MYDFRTLSPLDFEELVRDLLQAEFGIRLECFGADLGIDFRYSRGGVRTIVQAKRYIDRTADAIVTAASDENPKVRKLGPVPIFFPVSPRL
jgi:HJR/Mrr/RecB family endonuclease